MADLSQFGVPTVNGTAITMPKLQYRFRVLLFKFGRDAGAGGTDVTQNVVSVSRPSITHDEIIVDSYNSKAYLAGKHTWDPITLTIRDDMNNKVSAAVAAQLEKQLNHASQKVPGNAANVAGQDYKFGMMIQQLDGSDATTPLETWTVNGCFITNANYNENNYATSDVMQITLSIRFDNADVHSGEAAGVEVAGGLSGIPLTAGTIHDVTG